MVNTLKKELQSLADPDKAKILQRFFKTGKGEYGEGDLFLGITVPEQRKLAKKYQGLTLAEVQKLLSSTYHEHRLTSLLIIVIKYSKSDDVEKKDIIDFYLKNTGHINNWDLVDSSAPYIVGDYLDKKDRKPLYGFALSKDLWKRRIAIISTFLISFANLSSIGMVLGTLKVFDKEKAEFMTKNAGKLLLVSTLASLLTACVVGIIS